MRSLTAGDGGGGDVNVVDSIPAGLPSGKAGACRAPNGGSNPSPTSLSPAECPELEDRTARTAPDSTMGIARSQRTGYLVPIDHGRTRRARCLRGALCLVITLAWAFGISGTASAVAGSKQAVVSVSGGPQLLFDDEFVGGLLNARKWAKGWLPPTTNVPVNATEDQCYGRPNVRVLRGELDLILRQRSQTCGGVRRPFTSGMVNTHATFRYVYGYAEARIWLPAGVGLWPAWWTDGENWPSDGEIDVVEAHGNDSRVEYHYHYAGCGGNCAPGGATTLPGSTSGWHTYGMDWEPGSITWYYDGLPVWSTSGSAVPSSPQYLILNLATTSVAATAPSIMRVDYVRVYTSKP